MTERDPTTPTLMTRRAVLAAVGASGVLATRSVHAAPSGIPVELGIIANSSTVSGTAIANAAEFAVDALNQAGGVLGRPLQLTIFDDRNSTRRAVGAFRRMINRDRVITVIGCSNNQTALAIAPWSARLKTPFVVSGASSDGITEQIHKDYDRFKYVFQGTLNTSSRARCVTDSARDLLVGKLHMTSCVIMSEDAPWASQLDAAYRARLSGAGLTLLDEIRFAPDTKNFSPIFSRILAKKPDVVLTGLHEAGVALTTQWAKARIPVPMVGISDQAAAVSFWDATHGAASGIVAQALAGPDAAITPKTLSFIDAYDARFAATPPPSAFATHDMMYVVAQAIARAKGTAADAIVAALEATDQEETMGRVKFYGRAAPFTHGLVYGAGLVQGVMLQWQQGTLRTIWPLGIAQAKITFPSFVKLPS